MRWLPGYQSYQQNFKVLWIFFPSMCNCHSLPCVYTETLKENNYMYIGNLGNLVTIHIFFSKNGLVTSSF